MKIKNAFFPKFIWLVFILILFFYLSSAMSAQADTLYFKNGSVVENVKTWKEGNLIKWYQYGSLISYDENNIKKIEYSDPTDDSHLESQVVESTAYDDIGFDKKKNRKKSNREKLNREALDISPCVSVDVYRNESGQVDFVSVDCRGICSFKNLKPPKRQHPAIQSLREIERMKLGAKCCTIRRGDIYAISCGSRDFKMEKGSKGFNNITTIYKHQFAIQVDMEGNMDIYQK